MERDAAKADIWIDKSIKERAERLADIALNIWSLPEEYNNKKVVVIVYLQQEKTVIPSLTMGDIDAMFEGSITESLIGILPQTGMSLEDYRSERLGKYECAS